MLSIPSTPGAYVVHLSLLSGVQLQVGKLGEYFFPAADYLYLGSARGSGGLRARLERHIAGQPKRVHWHIDHLRRASVVPQIFYTTCSPVPGLDDLPLECCWSQALIRLPSAWTPAPGFGASDCRSGCPAHLIAFHRLPEKGLIIETLNHAVVQIYIRG